MLRITDKIKLDENELVETFIRAGGPGGQNVNKVATAVQLRFDVRRSPSLPEPVRRRLEQIAGSRLTRDGEIVITAHRFRTQDANRRDARDRLAEMIRKAAARPQRRVPTRPGRAARERRLNEKTQRSKLKKLRRAPPPER